MRRARRRVTRMGRHSSVWERRSLEAIVERIASNLLPSEPVDAIRSLLPVMPYAVIQADCQYFKCAVRVQCDARCREGRAAKALQVAPTAGTDRLHGVINRAVPGPDGVSRQSQIKIRKH